MWFAPVCMFCSHAPVTVRWLWLPSILVVRFNCLEVTAVPMNVRPVPCSPRLPARLLLLLLHPPVRVGIQLVSSILLPQITMDLLQHCFLLCGNGHLTFTEIYFRPWSASGNRKIKCKTLFAMRDSKYPGGGYDNNAVTTFYPQILSTLRVHGLTNVVFPYSRASTQLTLHIFICSLLPIRSNAPTRGGGEFVVSVGLLSHWELTVLVHNTRRGSHRNRLDKLPFCKHLILTWYFIIFG